MARSQRVEAYLPHTTVEEIEVLVEESEQYDSRSAFIREAVEEKL